MIIREIFKRNYYGNSILRIYFCSEDSKYSYSIRGLEGDVTLVYSIGSHDTLSGLLKLLNTFLKPSDAIKPSDIEQSFDNVVRVNFGGSK